MCQSVYALSSIAAVHSVESNALWVDLLDEYLRCNANSIEMLEIRSVENEPQLLIKLYFVFNNNKSEAS